MPAKAKHAPLIRNCQTLERWPVIRDAFERQREETKEKRHQGRPVQQPSSTTEPDPDPVDTVQLSIRPFGAGVTAAFKKQLDGATELSVSVPRKATKARVVHDISENLRVVPSHFELGLGWRTFHNDPTYEADDAAEWSEGFANITMVPPFVVYVIDAHPASTTEDVDAYNEAHPFPPFDWRLVDPTHESLPDTATWQQRCTARFGLIQPFPEVHPEATWRAYYEERSELEAMQDPTNPEHDMQYTETGDYRGVIREDPYEVLTRIFTEDDDAASILSDGVLFVHGDGMGDDDYASSVEGHLVVRVYPPNTLSYLEIAFFYHQRARWSTVEQFGALGYRFYERTARNPPEDVQKVFERSVQTAFARRGWKSVFWHYLDDAPVRERLSRAERRGGMYGDFYDEDGDEFDEDDDMDDSDDGEDDRRQVERCGVGLTARALKQVAKFLGFPKDADTRRMEVLRFVLACATIEEADGSMQGLGSFGWSFSSELRNKLLQAIGETGSVEDDE